MSVKVTLKDFDEKLAQQLRREAEQRQVSFESLISDLLRLGWMVAQQQGLHHDLDVLAGTWSEEEAAAFEAATVDFTKVDEQLWR